MRPPPAPTFCPCAYAYHKMMAAWRREEELHCRSQSKRQSYSPPGFHFTSLSRRCRTRQHAPAGSTRCGTHVVLHLPDGALCPVEHDGTATGPATSRSRYRLGLLTYMFTVHMPRHGAGILEAGDRSISGGPVDSCAVSVFPLPFVKRLVHADSRTSRLGKGRKGRRYGALNLMCRLGRCDGLGYVTDSGEICEQMGTGRAGKLMLRPWAVARNEYMQLNNYTSLTTSGTCRAHMASESNFLSVRQAGV